MADLPPPAETGAGRRDGLMLGHLPAQMIFESCEVTFFLPPDTAQILKNPDSVQNIYTI